MKDLFERLAQRRKEFTSPHLSVHVVTEKMEECNLTEEEILKAYKTGKLFREKCEKPDKIGIAYYDGKRKRTVVLIVRMMKDFAKVVTVWVEPGRP